MFKIPYQVKNMQEKRHFSLPFSYIKLYHLHIPYLSVLVSPRQVLHHHHRAEAIIVVGIATRKVRVKHSSTATMIVITNAIKVIPFLFFSSFLIFIFLISPLSFFIFLFLLLFFPILYLFILLVYLWHPPCFYIMFIRYYSFTFVL